LRLEEVLSRALRLVKPSRREEERLGKVVDEALRLAREEAEGVDGIVDVTLEGSAAKRTWIRGREEADIFIHFEAGVSRERLEECIIQIGSNVIRRMGGRPMLMYAEHPYVEGVVDGVTIDVVACYRVEPPNWISATDRTPYHTRYVLENLRPGQEEEVRLLKGFMLGCGVYGAEIKIRGFSGYLAELLTLSYGSFIKVLEAASSWRPPIILDPAGHYKSREEVLDVFRDSPLIVIDPVDRSRNAAAAVSETKLSEFMLAAKLFLRNPSIRFFTRRRRRIRVAELRRMAEGRSIVYIYFKLGEPRPRDVLWGELRRSEDGVRRALERAGFQVYRSDSWTDEEKTCLMIFELDGVRLPKYMLHRGPPIHIAGSEEFVEKWVGGGVGPWIQGDRLYVLRRRGEVEAPRILRAEIRSGGVAISKGIQDYVKRARIGGDINSLISISRRSPSLLAFLWRFLRARPDFL